MDRKSLSDILRAGTNAGSWVDSDWSGVAPAPEFAPLPAGKYIAHLADKTFETSAKSTPSVTLVFTVCDGEYQGRKLWAPLWLTDAAAPQTRRDLAKLGITSKAQLEAPLPTSKRIRCELRVVIQTGDNGNTFNKVRSFDVLGVDEIPADPFAPGADTAPTTDAAPLDPAAPRPSLFGDGHQVANGAYGGGRR